MSTKETIEELRNRAYDELCALFSRGNVTLQEGGYLTEEDFDQQLAEVASIELGDY